jgi:hypothetical protein
MGRGDDDISAELVMDDGAAVLYVEQDDKPLATENIKGSLSASGPGRALREAKLVPAGANKLKTTELKPVSGDRLRAHIILPDGGQYQWVFSFR